MRLKAFATLFALSAIIWAAPPVAAVPVPDFPQGIAANPATGRVYVSGEESHSVFVVDGVTSRVQATIPVGIDPVGVAVNPNTNLVYVANSGNDSVSVIAGATNRVIAEIAVGRAPIAVAANPNTNRIFVACEGSNSIFVIDGNTQRVIRALDIGPDSFPNDVAVSTASGFVYVTTRYDSFTVIIPNGDDYSDRRQIFLGNKPRNVAVNTPSQKVYFTMDTSRSVFVVRDGGNFDLLATIALPGRAYGIAANPASNLIYVTHPDTFFVSAIDGQTDTLAFETPVGDVPVAVDVNPTSRRLYVANAESNNVSVRLENDLLLNPSFDGDADRDSRPDRWRWRNLGAGDRTDTNAFDGRFSFKFVGAVGVEKELLQSVRLTGVAGSGVNLEGFSKASGTSPGGGSYDVKAKVFYVDGSTDAFALNFSKATHDWERKYRRLTAAKDFDRIRVSVVYADQPATSTVWFDALHLWLSP